MTNKTEKYLPLTENVLERLHGIGLEVKVKESIKRRDPTTTLYIYQTPMEMFEEEEKDILVENMSNELRKSIKKVNEMHFNNNTEYLEKLAYVIRTGKSEEDIISLYGKFGEVYSHLKAIEGSLREEFKDFNFPQDTYLKIFRNSEFGCGDPGSAYDKKIAGISNSNSSNWSYEDFNLFKAKAEVGKIREGIYCIISNDGYDALRDSLKSEGFLPIYHHLNFMPTIDPTWLEGHKKGDVLTRYGDELDMSTEAGEELFRKFPGIGKLKL